MDVMTAGDVLDEWLAQFNPGKTGEDYEREVGSDG